MKKLNDLGSLCNLKIAFRSMLPNQYSAPKEIKSYKAKIS